MNSLLIQVLAGCVLLLFIYVSIRKADADGFFPTLCTTGVLYAAFRFAYVQWRDSYSFLIERLGMDSENALERATLLSASYWLGFVVILLPAMFYVKLLTREPAPFPGWLEQGGRFVLGVVCGVLFFLVILNGFSRFAFFQEHLQPALSPFQTVLHLFQVL